MIYNCNFDAYEIDFRSRVVQLTRTSPNPDHIRSVQFSSVQLQTELSGRRWDSDAGTGRLALVFELMEMNLYELIRGRTQYLPEDRIRKYMYQLLKAIDHMHRNGVFHR